MKAEGHPEYHLITVKMMNLMIMIVIIILVMLIGGWRSAMMIGE